MKKLILGLGIQLVILSVISGQQINALELHEGSSKSVHALSDIDSIVHTTDSLIIHKGNQKSWYGQSGLDSANYVSLSSSSLPCSFGGYTGSYGSMTDARDGNVYKTVTIGNQRWMAENLRYDVPGVYTYWNTSSDNATDTLNSSSPCRSYGRLYDWNTIMNGASSSSGVQGICPSGWHLPSDVEWKTLEKALGMSQSSADSIGWRGTDELTKMKSVSGWSNFNGNSGNGTNGSGFNAFPAGAYVTGSFYNLGDGANFWSSTVYSASLAWYRDLFINASVGRYCGGKSLGLSCRCVEN